jgi:hypothetical protein
MSNQVPPNEDLEGLRKLLPALEQDCEDARRCFSVIAENFHAARSRLAAMLKSGKSDEVAVHEFHQAVVETGKNLAPLLETIRQIEAATNEMVEGARELPRG